MSMSVGQSGVAPRAKRSKNIVLCADGTGNSGGKGHSTNVWRIFNAVDLRCHEGGVDTPKQLAFYDDGVGTEDFKLLRLLGGAFGWGLSRNIRELYETLARNYEPGDRVYVFGFSRGAFTARSLAGMIARVGIVDLRKELEPKAYAQLRQACFPWRGLGLLLAWLGVFRWLARHERGAAYEEVGHIKLLVKAAFNAYRRRHQRRSVGSPTWLWFELLRRVPGLRRLDSHDHNVAYFKRHFSVDGRASPIIQCVGVWDTVGALGAPADWMRAIVDWWFSISFHDQTLHPCVRFGFQALAIDDERRTFAPILWTEPARRSDNDSQHVEQVWFAGVHSNVGGGYPKQGLASVSLYWMMRRAKHAGLVFQADALERARGRANVHDKLYDSRAGLAAYYRYGPRDIARLAKRHCQGGQASVHYTVFDRIASGVQDYVPTNLPAALSVSGDDIGRERTRDHVALDYWITRLERTGITAHQSALIEHTRLARKWVRARQAMYYVMLLTTIGVAAGIAWLHVPSDGRLKLPSSVRVLLAPLRQTLAAIDPLFDSLVPADIGEGIVNVGGMIGAWLLPQTLRQWLQPSAAYFGAHPGRLTACVWLLVAYLLVRSWLARKTLARFERFWSPLRGPVPAASAANAAPDIDIDAASELTPRAVNSQTHGGSST